jgi:hypothetical protein
MRLIFGHELADRHLPFIVFWDLDEPAKNLVKLSI